MKNKKKVIKKNKNKPKKRYPMGIEPMTMAENATVLTIKLWGQK
jgi:hypothetical protein